MFSTAIAILGAVALLSPGFVIVEISEARRARAKRGDLELALRAITYAVFVHLAFGWWTTALIHRVKRVDEIPDHLGTVSLYVSVVLVLAPVASGLLISHFVARAEQRDGPPGVIAAALGAGHARDAFDYAFQRRTNGAWVIIRTTTVDADGRPEFVGGVYGKRSAIGQSPSPHDVYLENVARVELTDDGIPYIAGLADPPQGVYVPAAQIVRVDIYSNADPEQQSAGRPGRLRQVQIWCKLWLMRRHRRKRRSVVETTGDDR